MQGKLHARVRPVGQDLDLRSQHVARVKQVQEAKEGEIGQWVALEQRRKNIHAIAQNPAPRSTKRKGLRSQQNWYLSKVEATWRTHVQFDETADSQLRDVGRRSFMH